MLYFKREYLLREQSMATFLLMICILIALVAASIIVIKIQKKAALSEATKKKRLNRKQYLRKWQRIPI